MAVALPRSSMKARDTLFYGLILVVLAAVLYTIHIAGTEVHSVTDCTSAYHCETYSQIECKFFGLKGGQCTMYSYLMYGACGVVSFVGAVTVAVSLYRLIEAPRVSALPSPPGLCPKCGAMNPPTSKFCNECATKLA